MFMLGLTLLVVLTGVNLRNLPFSYLSQFTEDILDKIVSREMNHTISSLIDQNSFRKIDNTQLRRLLKEKEA